MSLSLNLFRQYEEAFFFSLQEESKMKINTVWHVAVNYRLNAVSVIVNHDHVVYDGPLSSEATETIERFLAYQRNGTSHVSILEEVRKGPGPGILTSLVGVTVKLNLVDTKGRFFTQSFLCEEASNPGIVGDVRISLRAQGQPRWVDTDKGRAIKDAVDEI